MLQKDYEELRITDFRVELRGGIACYILRKYIENEGLTLKLSNSLFNIILEVNSILSKSYFIKNVTDYFLLLLNDDNFFSQNSRFRYLNCMHTALNSQEGAKIYLRIFYSRMKSILNLNPAIKQPKIAVLITGQLRGDFEYFLQQNIVDIIEPASADMFLFSWDEAVLYPGLRGCRPWINRLFTFINPQAPKEIQDMLGLKKYFPNVFKILDKPIKCEIDAEKFKSYDFKGIILASEKEFEKEFNDTRESLLRYCESKVKQNYDFSSQIEKFNDEYELLVRYWENNGKQNYGFIKSLELMKDYEKKHNFEYDFVIRIRPDVKYFDFEISHFQNLADNQIVTDSIIYGVSDMKFYGKREAMVKFLSIFGNKEFEFFGRSLGIHTMYYDWAIFNNLEILDTKAKIKHQSFGFEKFFVSNFSKELELDLKNLKQNGVSEEKLQDYKDFFTLVCEYYNIEPEKRQEYFSTHPLFLKLKEKKNEINQAQQYWQGAVLRVKNHLSYKLGQIIIRNSKSFFDLLKIPFLLIAVTLAHKEQEKAYKEKIKANPNLALPALEKYPDYQEALKEKECLTYKLGSTFIKAYKSWYKGGMIKFYFEAKALGREFKNKKAKQE